MDAFPDQFGPFSGRVIVAMTGERRKGRVEWETLEPILFTADDGAQVWIRAGARTDWNSVRRWMTPWVPVCDKGCLAALLHDDLLQRPWLYPEAWQSRRVKDRIFRGALKRLGVALWRRWVMWAAVRVQAHMTGDRG